MTVPQFWVEILNTKSSTFGPTSNWTDITSSVLDVQAQALGFQAPRSLSPSGSGTVKLVLDNSANVYLPDNAGYAGNKIVEDYNRVRIRATGATLGNCLKATIYNNGLVVTGTFYQRQTLAVPAGSVWTTTFYARAQYDFVSNTNTVPQILNSAGDYGYLPSFVLTNKWQQFTITMTSGGVASTWIQCQIYQVSGTGSPGHQYVEYKNFTLTCPTVNGGLNVLVNGDFSTGAVSPWATYSSDGVTVVTVSVVPDSWIVFNGKINNVQTDSAALGGTQQTILTCYDFYYYWQKKKFNPPPAIQLNVSSDSLINTTLTYMQAARSVDWWPGQMVDSGILTNIGLAFDKYSSTTPVTQAIIDVVDSEFGAVWFDLDGTFRFGNQQWLVKKQRMAAAIALTDGYSFQVMPERNADRIINNVAMTYHPRSAVAGLNPIWTQNQITPIPPGTTITISVQFKDLFGQPCGAIGIVTAMLANTDYKISEFIDGGGGDYTSSGYFTITCTAPTQAGQPQATQATLTMTNTATGCLYAQILQVRGIPVTTYGPQQALANDAVSIARTIQSDFIKDLLFVNDHAMALAMAKFYIYRNKDPFVELPAFAVNNKQQINGIDVLGLQIGDPVAVTSSKLGWTNAQHIITGVSYVLNPRAGVANYSASLRINDPNLYAIVDTSLCDSSDVCFI